MDDGVSLILVLFSLRELGLSIVAPVLTLSEHFFSVSCSKLFFIKKWRQSTAYKKVAEVPTYLEILIFLQKNAIFVLIYSRSMRTQEGRRINR